MVPARLLTRLDRAAAGPAPVLLLAAPSGSGKSALVTAWSEHLTAVRPGTGTVRIPADCAQEFLHDSTFHRLCRETGRADLLLVIEDAHRLVSEEALAAVERFLRTAPPRLITVLAARRPPGLPWHDLASTARLTRFTAADLALDRTGTAALAAAAGCPLTAAELPLVHELTRGWPALVRLAARYLDTHREYRAAALTMLEHAPCPIAEFLDTEVLAELDHFERELLAATRLLPEFTADLADALTEGRATAALHRLEHAGFPLRRQRRDGRLYHSFAPLLRGHYRHSVHPTAEAVWTDQAPDVAADPAALPVRPSTGGAPSVGEPSTAAENLRRWYRTHPCPTVLPHLLAEPGRPRVAEFLRAHAVRLVLDQHGPDLFEPLERARSALLDDPALVLLHTVDVLVRGEDLTHLTQPPRGASRIADPRTLAALHAATAADLAIHADPGTLRELVLPPRPALSGHTAVDYYAELALATAHTLRGDTRLGERGLRRALALAEAMAAPRLRLRAQIRLALTAVLADRPEIAAERAAHAVAMAERADLAGTADHLRALAIRGLCAAQRARERSGRQAEPRTVQRTGAGAPRVAETGDSVLFRSVRRVVAESSR